MKKITILTLLMIFISCNKKTYLETYSIKGKVKNAPDSTKILLYLYPKADIIADSTYVINENFSFKGEIKRPRLAHLRIISSRDNKTFWLENNEINFISKIGDFFKSSVITGSKTQKESEILLKRKDSIFNEMHELEAIVTDSNRDSLFKVYEKMENYEAQINADFIKEFPDSYESLFRLYGSKERLGGKETSKLFSFLSNKLQDTEEGKTIKEFIVRNKSLKVGDTYVDLAQPNIDDKVVKLSEVKGKYTLIEFWASWCSPCRSSNPELVEQYKLYKDKGFEIFGVSLDTNKDKWKQAVEKDGLLWENVSDLRGGNNKASMIYGVRDLPDNFLIDENGVIIARYLRGNKLKNTLKELFK